MFDDLNIPSDATILGFFIMIIVIISVVIYKKTKKKWLGIISFSVLGNIAVLSNIGMVEIVIYDIIWIQYLILYAWPIVNLILIIYYILKLRRIRND